MKTNPRVGIYYSLGAMALAIFIWFGLPWGYLLIWPVLSLVIISAGYFKLGPKVYFKNNGRHAIWVKALHCFPLLGHELSRRAYSKQCDAWDRLLPNLLIGRQLRDFEVQRLQSEGVTAVLDLTAEFSEPTKLREMEYLGLPLLDLTAPTDDELDRALAFIRRQGANGIVYLHCKIGYSRTAAISGSFLVHSGKARSAEEAIKQLKNARPKMVIRPEARATIQRYEERCLQS